MKPSFELKKKTENNILFFLPNTDNHSTVYILHNP